MAFLIISTDESINHNLLVRINCLKLCSVADKAGGGVNMMCVRDI